MYPNFSRGHLVQVIHHNHLRLHLLDQVLELLLFCYCDINQRCIVILGIIVFFVVFINLNIYVVGYGFSFP